MALGGPTSILAKRLWCEQQGYQGFDPIMDATPLTKHDEAGFDGELVISYKLCYK